ncbi:MAG: acyl--CoA ligase [Bacilli bacterium]|nr:acyl--CoA ligase [Bacilli bacterium]
MSIFEIFRRKKEIPAPWSKYYKEEDVNIKIPNISMYEQVKRSTAKYPSYTAYEYFRKKTTYKTFLNEIDASAAAFKVMGIKKGDIVTLCMPNVPEVLIALYGLNKLGAIANMLHPLSAEEEIKDNLISTNSEYLVMIDMFYHKIEKNIEETKIKKVIFVSASDSMGLFMKIGYKLTQGRKFLKYPKNEKFLSWKTFLKQSKKLREKMDTKFGKDTPAVIIHSGGTSGTPKNVVIQNRAFILAAKQEQISLKQLKPGDCCLAIMPNFHGFGLSVLMHTPLALGCYTILVPQFDSKKFDILFKKTRPTCVLGVPTLFEALSENHNIKHLDLSFLKYAVSGGDLLNSNLENKINEYFKAHNSTARITQGYGLSEALAAVCLAADDVNKSGSVGIPLAGNYVKIIDPATRETLPFGETGEIVVHTKALMMGYLNNEAETNEALQVHKDGHVWLHTGDLGYMDEDGFVFYKGRQKRMIISSGYNVFPSHIEEVIEAHPAVLQCTVVGVPHPYKGEVPKAFIVLKEGFHGLFIKSEIREYSKKNLAKYMIPSEFVYRKKLPKTKLGKVDFIKLQSDIGVDDDE